MADYTISYYLLVCVALPMILNGVPPEVMYCRPMCLLPEQSEGVCQKLQVLFSCITPETQRQVSSFTDKLYCGCIWETELSKFRSHGPDNYGVKESRLFQTCERLVEQHCGEWKEKGGHFPQKNRMRRLSTKEKQKYELMLKASNIKQSLHSITDDRKRNALLTKLSKLLNQTLKGNDKPKIIPSTKDKKDGKAVKTTPRPTIHTIIKTIQGKKTTKVVTTTQQYIKVSGSVDIEGKGQLDGWHDKALFENWEKVSKEDLMETIRKRKTMIVIAGIVIGGTVFIIVMLLCLKHQSDAARRPGMGLKGDLDILMKKQDKRPVWENMIKKLRKRRDKRNSELEEIPLKSIISYPKFGGSRKQKKKPSLTQCTDFPEKKESKQTEKGSNSNIAARKSNSNIAARKSNSNINGDDHYLFPSGDNYRCYGTESSNSYTSAREQTSNKINPEESVRTIDLTDVSKDDLYS